MSYLRQITIALLFSVTALTSAASPLDELVERGNNAYYGRGVAQSYTAAADIYQAAAAQGSAEAAHYLGYMYQNGLGRELSLSTAIDWYAQAAEAEYPQSQFTLGQLAETGTGTQRNLREALLWYRQAADNGYALAQLRLGMMHAQGIGTPVDFIQATYYSALAYHRGGNKVAAQLLKTLLPFLPKLSTQLEYSTLWALPEPGSRPVGQVYQGSEVYLLEQLSRDWMVVYSPEARKVAYLNTRSFIPQTATAAGNLETR